MSLSKKIGNFTMQLVESAMITGVAYALYLTMTYTPPRETVKKTVEETVENNGLPRGEVVRTEYIFRVGEPLYNKNSVMLRNFYENGSSKVVTVPESSILEANKNKNKIPFIYTNTFSQEKPKK